MRVFTVCLGWLKIESKACFGESELIEKKFLASLDEIIFKRLSTIKTIDLIELATLLLFAVDLNYSEGLLLYKFKDLSSFQATSTWARISENVEEVPMFPKMSKCQFLAIGSLKTR